MVDLAVTNFKPDVVDTDDDVTELEDLVLLRLLCIDISFPSLILVAMRTYHSPMARHRVYLYFQLRNGWQCQFLLPDLKTTAARPITFQDPAKIVEMAERGNAMKDLAAKQALD